MSGLERIAAERRRQTDELQYGAVEDDEQHDGAMAKAAACYARCAARVGGYGEAAGHAPSDWPATWGPWQWKPEPREGGQIKPADAIRMLEKAGALIAAEIDRLERLQEREAEA